jgi:hypothetical protein
MKKDKNIDEVLKEISKRHVHKRRSSSPQERILLVGELYEFAKEALKINKELKLKFYEMQRKQAYNNWKQLLKIIQQTPH